MTLPWTARRATSWVLLCFAFAFTGCQSKQPSALTIPPPNLAPPQIAMKPLAIASAPAPAPKPSAPLTRITPTRVTGPVDWKPAVSARNWQWIVIHHSATVAGGADAFDRMHKAKGWDELGYHFVIGNGTDTRDGFVEMGPRWTKQKHGAHAKTADNRYNELGIGICLVGNFDLERPTPEQMKQLARLVAFLQQTYNIPSSRVIGHSDTKPTDCPGKLMSLAHVRRLAAQLAAGNLPADEHAHAGAELLTEAR